MATLAFYGGVQPSEYCAMTWRDAQQLEHELIKLRKQEIDLEINLAKLGAGMPQR